MSALVIPVHLAIVLAAATLAACGGTVIFDDSGNGDGNGDGGANGSGYGDGSGIPTNGTPNAGSAGPSGVGGADTGPCSGQASSGVGGPGCLYVEGTADYCYKHSTCNDVVRETECEETGAEPGKCWCFEEGVFVAECTQSESYCNVGANGDCCAGEW